MRKRRGARILALQVLYALDIHGDMAEQDSMTFSQLAMDHLALISVEPEIQEEEKLSEEEIQDHSNLSYLLISGVHGKQKEIDARIEEASDNWTVKRLSIIDRNILRIAVFEIIYIDEVPARVAINEAIEIAKSFGTDNSPKFINGVLDRIYRIIGHNNSRGLN